MKKALLFLIVFYLAGSGFALGLHIAVTPMVGITRGFLGETLFNYPEEDETNSYLEWDKNLLLYGVDVSVATRRLQVALQFEAGIPGISGVMEDSDWENDANKAMKTNYSVGENTAVGNYDCTLSLSFDISPIAVIRCAPLLQVQYVFDSFERDMAEGWYSDGSHWWFDDSSTHYPYTYWNDEKGRYVRVRLAGVDYLRHSLYTWLGFQLGVRVGSPFSITLGAAVSPYAYVYAIDTHHSQTMLKHSKHRVGTDWSRYSLFCTAQYGVSAKLAIVGSVQILLGETERGSLSQDFINWFGGAEKLSRYRKMSNDIGASVKQCTAKIGIKITCF